MSPARHSTPKVSAKSVYSRNKKLAEKKVSPAKPSTSTEKRLPVVSEKKAVRSKPVSEKGKENNSNLETKRQTLRKRKGDVNVNGTAAEKEEQGVKKIKGRMKKNEIKLVEIAGDENPDVKLEEQEQVVKKMKKEIERAEISDGEGSDVELEVAAVEIKKEQNMDTASLRSPTMVSGSPSGVRSSPNKKTSTCGNEAAEEAFRWLLSPISPEFFFEEIYEKKPFHIQRSFSNYYKGLYSTKDFEKIVRENHLKFNDEVDVVKYIDSERKQMIPEANVSVANLWNCFRDGYSLRIRNPQVYHKPLLSLCSLLQEYFSSAFGTNMYLTPPDSQGFPPHFDDIDAFILQIEGKKQWKLYTPGENDMLARFSSPDLSEDQIGEPYMTVELNAGDLLYFPRGFIHQANTVPGVHSMHITLSTNQCNTWGDLLKNAFSRAINLAMQNDIEFRKSIPKDYLDYMGSIHFDDDSKERKDFEKKASSLVQKSLDYLNPDTAADLQAINFIQTSVPPCLSEKEKGFSFHGNGVRFIDSKVQISEPLGFTTKIRLIRKRAFRLVVDEEGTKLYHTLYNGLNCKEFNSSLVEVEDDDFVPALTTLIKTYPDYIKIKDLPNGRTQYLLDYLQKLYDTGYLMTERLLQFED